LFLVLIKSLCSVSIKSSIHARSVSKYKNKMSSSLEISLDLKPEASLVTKESFREEIDPMKKNLKIVGTQTFSNRKYIIGLGLLTIVLVFALVVLGVLIYVIQENIQASMNRNSHKIVKMKNETKTGLTK